MAYSGTRTFNLNIEEIIEEAYERCGLEVRSGYDLKTARRSLNLMFSDWANRGLNLWTIDYATQTMTAGTNFYTIDQKVVDIVDAVITTTAGATANIEGDKNTTDVSITKISRTEYMNLKYFYINRIQDAGDYNDNADVPFYFLPCLVSGLAYYMSLKRAPMLTANLKAVYDEEFNRTADANRERVSFRVKPAQAYIP